MTLADVADFADAPGAAACPGCLVAGPAARDAGPASGATVDLALPGIHCAACISSVESGLRAVAGVRAARVNLTERRVRVTLAPGAAAPTPEGLIDVLAGLGHAAQVLDADLMASVPDAAARALSMRVAVAGFAMMNVTLLSVAVWSGAAEGTRSMFHWLSAAIALPAVAFCGRPFFDSAIHALRAHRLNMDVPISLAIVLAAGMSLYETMWGGAATWFDAALSLTFFLLVGRWLDQRSRTAAQSAATRLAALEVPRVLRLTDAGRETVPLARIAVGDRVAVLPGARVPVDGIVHEGISDLDLSLLTGESLPQRCGPGDAAQAGTLNGPGALVLRVTAVGEDTALRRIATMIDQAESAKNTYTALADRAAQIYAPLVHILALVAFAGWVAATGDIHRALGVAVAVLIITCPCALGLAVPAVATAAAGHLFARGVLVKSGTALERLAAVDTVVFDKTGTLTDGILRTRAADLPPDAAAVALALAQASTHPVARAIAQGLVAEGVQAAPLTGLTEFPGLGIAAQSGDGQVRLGAAGWTGQAARDADRAGTPGAWLATPQGAWFLGLDADLRDGAEEAVAALIGRGYTVRLMSGDTSQAVRGVARRLGIADWQGAMSPEAKVAALDGLAAGGARVLMVGDGLNDAAALARAFASVSPGTASDAARVASDVVLLGRALSELPRLMTVARRARARSLENFAIAAVYNIVAVPLALAGIATPLMAAIAMSTSSITVLVNALRVRA